MFSLTKEQIEFVEKLRKAQLDTNEGMPEELFLLISGLVPLANVDLLIKNAKGQILLTRRCDPWYQESWHIPGGCMHYMETFRHCVEFTARRELGISVTVDPEPVAVRNVIRGIDLQKEYPRERGHNVAILFRCHVPRNWQIDNGNKTVHDNGYLAWFDKLPQDFMEMQHVYDDVLTPWR